MCERSSNESGAIPERVKAGKKLRPKKEVNQALVEPLLSGLLAFTFIATLASQTRGQCLGWSGHAGAPARRRADSVDGWAR